MTSHPRRQWYLKCNTFYLLYHYRKECKFCWIKSYTILPFSGLAHVSVLVDKTDGLPYCKGYLPRLNSRSNLKQPLPVSLSTCRVPVYWPSARRNLSLYEDTSTLSPFSEHILNCKEHIKQCKKFNPVSNGFYLAWNTYKKNIYIFKSIVLQYKSLHLLQVCMMLLLNEMSSNKDALEIVIWFISLRIFVGIYRYFGGNCKNFVHCRQRQRVWAKC